MRGIVGIGGGYKLRAALGQPGEQHYKKAFIKERQLVAIRAVQRHAAYFSLRARVRGTFQINAPAEKAEAPEKRRAEAP